MDGCHCWLGAESGEKKQLQVPGSIAVKNGPIDCDLQSILETPLDFPREGDALRGENAGGSGSRLLLHGPLSTGQRRPGGGGPVLGHLSLTNPPDQSPASSTHSVTAPGDTCGLRVSKRKGQLLRGGSQVCTATRNPRKPILAQGSDGQWDSAAAACQDLIQTDPDRASGRRVFCRCSGKSCARPLNTLVNLSKPQCLCLSEFPLSCPPSQLFGEVA